MLIIKAIIITYIVGSFWYLFSESVHDADDPNTFNRMFGLDDPDKTPFDKLIISCYFALTTLSTVGYGDYYPISNKEKIAGIVVMLAGVAFFSYIMSSFIDIISNYNKKIGGVDRGAELHNWMTMLSRFTSNTPLSKNLIN